MIARRPLLVANPSAGSFRGGKALGRFLESYRGRFPGGKILLSLPEAPPQDFFASYSDRDLLVLYGGDGSVHRILQLRPPSALPILVFPGGTGNVLASFLGTKKFIRTPDLLWESLSEATQRPFRPGLAGRRRFVLMAGGGWDGHALKFIRGKDMLGPLAYYTAGLRSLLSRDLPAFSLTLHLNDGQRIDLDDVRWCLASRIAPYFGPFRSPQDMSPDSDTLHVTIVRRRRLGIITTFAGFLPGLSSVLPPCSYRVKNVVMSQNGSKNPPFQADGEAIPSPAILEIAPEVVSFLSFREKPQIT